MGWLVGGLVVLLVVSVVGGRRVVWLLVLGRGVSVAAGAVDGLGVVAGAEVLVEDGALAAVEGLLAAVLVAEVVDLRTSKERLSDCTVIRTAGFFFT